ncbi:MAG: hypothetical protein ACJ77M_06620 [Thermoleophilaceae bacterium]
MQEAVSTLVDKTRAEIPLSPAQTDYLTGEASFGALARLAFRVSLAVPLLLFGVCTSLTKLVARVPVIGWLLGIYGILLTVVAVVAGIVLIPVAFLVLLPAVLFGRRTKLRQDVARAAGVRQDGVFQVAENGAGGTLLSEVKKFRLSKTELDGLRPALTAGEDGATLTGALVHALNSGDLLAAYDESGEQLIGVAAA